MKEQETDQALWQIIWRDRNGDPHTEMFADFNESRNRTAALYEEGFEPNWHALDDKDPNAIQWRAAHAGVKFASKKDFEIIDRENGYVQYVGIGGSVVVPPVVDGCEVKHLDCRLRDITHLNITHNPSLTKLNCADNHLTTLDLTNNPALTELDCCHNHLTHLDTSHNLALTYLDCRCEHNKLATLDLTHNPELRYLNCWRNQLTTLDLTRNSKLIELRCGLNPLTTLDLTHNPNLRELRCAGSKLTTLDISHNPILLNNELFFASRSVQVQTTPQRAPEKPSAVSARENANTPAADRRTSAKSIAASTQGRPAISSPHKSKGALR